MTKAEMKCTDCGGELWDCENIDCEHTFVSGDSIRCCIKGHFCSKECEQQYVEEH